MKYCGIFQVLLYFSSMLPHYWEVWSFTKRRSAQIVQWGKAEYNSAQYSSAQYSWAEYSLVQGWARRLTTVELNSEYSLVEVGKEAWAEYSLVQGWVRNSEYSLVVVGSGKAWRRLGGGRDWAEYSLVKYSYSLAEYSLVEVGSTRLGWRRV